MEILPVSVPAGESASRQPTFGTIATVSAITTITVRWLLDTSSGMPER